MRKVEHRMAVIAISTCILILAILEMFAIYRNKNTEQVSRISETYIDNMTGQAADWMDDILKSASSSIHNMANLYSSSLQSPEVKTEDLKTMADNSLFNYVNFVDKDGINLTADGRKRNVSSRAYYINGMEGKTGMDGAYSSVVTGERMIAFYAPVTYQGEIIGVLTGHYLEERIKDIMETKLFDEEIISCLCLNDGTLIATMGTDQITGNIFEYLKDKVDESTYQRFQQAYSNQERYTFECQTEGGKTYGCIASILNEKWTLVQIFPPEAVTKLKVSADAAGLTLQMSLLALFAIYMAVLLGMEIRRRRELAREKNEVERIIEGINRLYSYFILIDLEADTYQYLNHVKPGFEELPSQGKFTDMREYFLDKFITQTEETPMSEVLQTAYIMEHFKPGNNLKKYEYKIMKNKEEVWEETAVIVLEHKGEKPNTFLLAIQEVTKEKNAEIQAQIAMREAYQMAQAANSAKSEFLSRMSHDIRTPMHGIMGMVAIANWNIDNQERVKDCLNKISVSSQHLLGLIDEVLDMSKIESGKFELHREKFNIMEFLREITDIAYSQMESRQQKLTVTLGGIIHENVIGDSQRLSQVLLNIIGNAVKFTPDEGNISIYMNEIANNASRNACFEFVITDSGIGMDEEFVNRIFDPFVREDDSRTSKVEGSGLGMSIAKNIVQMMNGEIRVKSKKGEGTQMWVTVFLEYLSQEEEDLSILEGRRVLLVDDDQKIYDRVSTVLNSVKMHCDYYDNVEIIQEAAKEQKTDYAVLLLDSMLLKQNSIKEIKDKCKVKFPIIILSEDDWSKNEREMTVLKAGAFLEKPMLESSLIPLLKRVLGESSNKIRSSEIELSPREAFMGARVLLVEDYDLNLEIGTEILHRAGFEVDVARDGKEAVDTIVAAPPDTYKLVLMDIQMPIMNGYEATIAIRNSGRQDLKKIPIIAMTANAFMDDIQKGLEAGMNGHISKPIKIDKMMELLELHMAEGKGFIDSQA